MKLGAVLAGSALLLGAAVVAAVAVNNGENAASVPAASSIELAQLAGEVEKLKERQSELWERIAELEESRPSSPSPGPVTADAVPAVAQAEEIEASADEAELILGEALDVILSDAPHSEQQQEWRRLAQAGLLDQAVAAIEEYATEHPNDPNAQTDLGHAFIQKVLAVNDLEKGLWAMKAHGAYDKALALDDHHWEARFSKAMSFAFAPLAFGLQPKAVEHLEILRAQQQEQPPQEHFAQTYTVLGNLYQNMGQPEKARGAWNEGLELFPENSELSEKLETISKGQVVDQQSQGTTTPR